MNLKTKEEIKIMAEGGAKLAGVRDSLEKEIASGINAWNIEELANSLIDKTGGEASFKMVDNYHWATCVNVNEGIVHGIPKKEVVFQKGDVVSVDVGLFYKGFHTDTSFTVGIDVDKKTKKFLDVGKSSLGKAIDKAVPGNRISDISKQMQQGVERHGYSVVRNLVGHGIGKNLHEDPQVPCFVPKNGHPDPVIQEGLAIAIEIMYTLGSPDVELSPDKWTIVASDGKISGLYEETVAITKNGPLVLTKSDLVLTERTKG